MTEHGVDPRLLEQRVSQIRGVISAKVIPGEEGEIGEIHVMATSQRAAKQLVRDIESLLLLHFKQRIDYRKISIVQLEGRRVTALRRIRLKAVEGETTALGQRWKVALEYEGKDHTGQWEGQAPVGETEGAAIATLNALLEIIGPGLSLALEEAKVAQMKGGMVVIASVTVGTPPQQETLLGSSLVKQKVAEASARAVLGALNRRLPFTVE